MTLKECLMQWPQTQRPTANPSGILCMVMAVTSKILRFQLVCKPSAWLLGNPMCKCGSILSMPQINNPPSRKPAAAGIHGVAPSASAISMAGFKRDQKLAAIITPAAKPSIVSSAFLFSDLKKKTTEAPRAVTPHVKQVAKKAMKIGFCSCNQCMRNDLNLSIAKYKTKALEAIMAAQLLSPKSIVIFSAEAWG